MRLTLAVALEAVFVVMAFGVRSWVQWRRTGSTGFVLPRRGAPAVERAGAALFGVALVLLVVAPIADSGDPSERIALVISGIFALVRNPIFSAMVLAVAGFVILVPSAWSVGAFVALVSGLELQVRFVEEPYLRRVHGDTYIRYGATAGRFLPGVGTIKASS